MMKKELMFLFAFVLVIGAAIGISALGNGSESASSDDSVTAEATDIVEIPQLTSEEREDAATMVLLGAPPLQPSDHIDRWNPELRHESCLTCHASPETTGAREIPEDHYYDNNIDNPIFRDNCVQCHGQQNDTKTAFNSEE
ncbi:nitrate reductase cytochrome c-type subunit [Bacillus dakarensis]|uniref:nitrate reductase cytochrome c-type subunit n=1 Tax=Robertmurraya dakarensis TaxID=1926278 RepID=UPI0009809D4F|nr:nitrate reductase cytochrome c-type subunit [Bacillus dakarensis]